MPIIQNNLVFFERPTIVASLLIRHAKNSDSVIDGNIIRMKMKIFSVISLSLSRANIAINEFGRMNNALWPEPASKLSAVK